jgi:hypothetical protein
MRTRHRAALLLLLPPPPPPLPPPQLPLPPPQLPLPPLLLLLLLLQLLLYRYAAVCTDASTSFKRLAAKIMRHAQFQAMPKTKKSSVAAVPAHADQAAATAAPSSHDDEQVAHEPAPASDVITIDASKGSVATFASLGLSPQLCDACTNMKWLAPTPIQEQSIPYALLFRLYFL